MVIRVIKNAVFMTFQGDIMLGCVGEVTFECGHVAYVGVLDFGSDKDSYILDDTTFGNSDNVSAHPLDKVCNEISQLVNEFPDRLTIGSTGGPVTGSDDGDKNVWQSNTKKLEYGVKRKT